MATYYRPVILTSTRSKSAYLSRRDSSKLIADKTMSQLWIDRESAQRALDRFAKSNPNVDIVWSEIEEMDGARESNPARRGATAPRDKFQRIWEKIRTGKPLTYAEETAWRNRSYTDTDYPKREGNPAARAAPITLLTESSIKTMIEDFRKPRWRKNERDAQFARESIASLEAELARRGARQSNPIRRDSTPKDMIYRGFRIVYSPLERQWVIQAKDASATYGAARTLADAKWQVDENQPRERNPVAVIVRWRWASDDPKKVRVEDFPSVASAKRWIKGFIRRKRQGEDAPILIDASFDRESNPIRRGRNPAPMGRRSNPMKKRANDLTLEAMEGYTGAPLKYLYSSPSWYAYKIGEYFRATGRPEPNDVRMGRGYSINVRDMTFSFGKSDAITRVK